MVEEQHYEQQEVQLGLQEQLVEQAVAGLQQLVELGLLLEVRLIGPWKYLHNSVEVNWVLGYLILDQIRQLELLHRELP